MTFVSSRHGYAAIREAFIIENQVFSMQMPLAAAFFFVTVPVKKVD